MRVSGKRYEFFKSLFIKLLVWSGLFWLLYLLRSFSLLIFLVFIFSYIQSNAVDRLERRIPKRTPRVVLVGLSFLAMFVLMISVLVPQIRHQGYNFISNSASYAQAIDSELVRAIARYPALEYFIPKASTDATVPLPADEWKFRNSTLARVLTAVFDTSDETTEKRSLISAFQTARDVGSKFLAIISQFLLSLLFSFLIVLDLPNLTKGARSLRDTKLRFVYDEMADNLVTFGRTVGRAFEAQFIVATVNTVLTALGIYAIHIRDEITFLSLIVFLCGFIPIAGVFISSVPICLLALAQGGLPKVALAILLITAVHAVESYILNPRIFGTHMKLNPVMVMILMTVSGKLFGVWGLVLCLPIATYIFQHAIQYKRPPLAKTLSAETRAEIEESEREKPIIEVGPVA